MIKSLDFALQFNNASHNRILIMVYYFPVCQEASTEMGRGSEVYLESRQTSKIKLFAQIVYRFWPLAIFAKSSTLDITQGSEYVSKGTHLHVKQRIVKKKLLRFSDKSF